MEQEEHSYILPEEGIQYENCFTLSNGQPLNTSVPTTAPPPDRGHFVLLLLKDPNSSCIAQIPFQIDSAASCSSMLPSCHLSSVPWAKILPSKTVILTYASTPIKPIGQVTLQASKGSSASNITFQVINTDQPALLTAEAGKALCVLTLHVDFIRKCSTSNPSQPPTTDPDSHQESVAGRPPPPPDKSTRIWLQLGILTLDFISKNCISLF